MSDAPETHILSSLSSDFARFILGDLQRLRTELAAAEQKAKTAERKLEQERNKRLKADERAENLQKEVEGVVLYLSHVSDVFSERKKRLRVESISPRRRHQQKHRLSEWLVCLQLNFLVSKSE